MTHASARAVASSRPVTPYWPASRLKYAIVEVGMASCGAVGSPVWWLTYSCQVPLGSCVFR